MIKFLEHKIKDPNFIRLVKRILRTPIQENGKIETSTVGAVQGGQISPVLSNIYLHYVLDLWFENCIKKEYKYSAHIVRYADDYVCCFGSEVEAKKFYIQLKERLKKFGLELADDKSKIIRFGRFAEEDQRKQDGKNPETFQFLGFTHYCSNSRDGKRYRVKRLTSKKKRIQSCAEIKKWMVENRHERPKWIFEKLNEKLTGFFNYYGITDNGKYIQRMRNFVQLTLFKTLKRRSNRHKLSWDSYFKMENFHTLKKAYTSVNIYEIIASLATEKL